MLIEMGFEVTVPMSKTAFTIADLTIQTRGYTTWPREERDLLWDTYSRTLVKGCKIVDTDGRVARVVEERLRSPKIWAPIYDAKPALSSLKKTGCLIGVVADAESTLTDALENAGLSGYIDTVPTSEEAGTEKPDPAIFRRAMEKSSLSPERCVHVGDVPELDVAGARSAGITPVWLDRNRLARRIGDVAKIETLTELEFMFHIVPHGAP